MAKSTTAAKAAKKNSATTAKAVKSTTANATAKAVEEHNVLVENTVEAIRKDSKATKAQPTAEELAAKAAKKAVSRRDKAVNEALRLTKGEVFAVSNWLKVLKKNFEKQYAKHIDEKWATICKMVEMAATGQYYLEEVTTKSGSNALKVHMIKFVPADKIGKRTILCSKNLKGFCYDAEEGVIAISNESELTIQRMVTEKKTITKVIEGETYSRVVENVVLKTLKPYEVFELSYGEFAKGIKFAMQTVFPDGFAIEK